MKSSRGEARAGEERGQGRAVECYEIEYIL